MLTLSEQLLLLALHDEKGSVIFSASTALPFGLAGAVLLSLFFHRKVELKDKKIQLVDTSNTGDAILDEALILIENSKKDHNAKYWVNQISRKVKDLRKRVTESLVQKEILKQEGRKFLWVFNVNRYPTANASPESELRNRIRNIIALNQSPTEEEIALLSLVKACSLVNEVFSKEERKEAKRKIKELTSDEQMDKLFRQLLPK